MGLIKISALPSASVPTDNDVLPIVDFETLTTTGLKAAYLLSYITSSTFQRLTVTSLTGSKIAMIDSVNHRDYIFAQNTNNGNASAIGFEATVGTTDMQVGATSQTFAGVIPGTSIGLDNAYMLGNNTNLLLEAGSNKTISFAINTGLIRRMTATSSIEKQSVYLSGSLNIDDSARGTYSIINLGNTVNTRASRIQETNNNGDIQDLSMWGTAPGFNWFGSSATRMSALRSTGALIMALGTADANPLILATNDTERVRIDATGSIGIGTQPQEVVHIKGTVIKLDGQIYGYSSAYNNLTGNYVLTNADNGKVISINAAVQSTVTIPLNLTGGFGISLFQVGIGTLFVTGVVGVTTFNRQNQYRTAGQYAVASLIYVSGNAYIFGGDTQL